MFVISYESAVDTLRKGVVFVRFIKKNGKVRDIYCTRNPVLITKVLGKPFEKADEKTIERERQTGHVNVFDLQKKDFRKINLTTLQKFMVYTGAVPDIKTNKTIDPNEQKAPKSTSLTSGQLAKLALEKYKDININF